MLVKDRLKLVDASAFNELICGCELIPGAAGMLLHEICTCSVEML